MTGRTPSPRAEAARRPMLLCLCIACICGLMISCAPRAGVPSGASAAGEAGSEVGSDAGKEPSSGTETAADPDAEPNAEKNDAVGAEPDDVFARIPAEDYGGREFIILSTDPEFTDASEDGGIISGALAARNRAIEEKFNIKITVLPVEETMVKPMLQNGTPCDLIYAPMETIAACGGSGLLMNDYSVPFFPVQSDYIQPELLASLSQNDTAYGFYGDAAYDARARWCVYFNKTVVMETLGYDPYEMVKNGTWTWDAFLAIANVAMADLDGNGRMNFAVDRYGYASSMHTSRFADAVFASFGKTFFSRDDEGFFRMDFADETADGGTGYISLLRNICVENGAKCPQRDPGADALSAFSEGRLAFFCEKLSYASNLAYSDIDWGILPMPKKDAAQADYASLVDPSVCGYAVPSGKSDSDLSGKVLDAIYAEYASRGEDTVNLAWIYYYLRSNDDAVMLRYLDKNPVYDAAYAFGEGMPDFAVASYELIRSVLEQNANFSYLYTQNTAPFSAFMRNRFVH